MKSYIDIVNTFKKICNQHRQVRTFTTGDIFEADLETQDVFTKVHLIETGASESLSCEPFTDRFENLLSGWKGTFNITVQAQNSACESPMTR